MTVQNPHDRFFRESFGRVHIQGREGERVMATIAQEYIQLGRIENLQDNILDLLEIRLGEVDEAMTERVTAVTDMPRLRQLLREAATAVTMTAFVERLDELTQED